METRERTADLDRELRRIEYRRRTRSGHEPVEVFQFGVDPFILPFEILIACEALDDELKQTPALGFELRPQLPGLIGVAGASRNAACAPSGALWGDRCAGRDRAIEQVSGDGSL